MTDIYLALDYRAYKHLEDQLRNWETIETSHTTVNGFYHKALRLELGDLTLEIQGPAVKQPELPPELATEDDYRWSPNWKVHPGEVVQEAMEERHWSRNKLAKKAGLSRTTIVQIMLGRTRITPTTAAAFERAFGITAAFWIGLQLEHERRKATNGEA